MTEVNPPDTGAQSGTPGMFPEGIPNAREWLRSALYAAGATYGGGSGYGCGGGEMTS